MRTAVAPSPTAEATRLIEPEHTSPAANTPARLSVDLPAADDARAFRDGTA